MRGVMKKLISKEVAPFLVVRNEDSCPRVRVFEYRHHNLDGCHDFKPNGTTYVLTLNSLYKSLMIGGKNQ